MIIITENKTPDQNKPTKAKSGSKPWIIAGVVLILIGGFTLWYNNFISHSYNSLPQINQATKLLDNLNYHANDDHLNYEYYYRPNCKHCQKMAKDGIVPKLKQASQSNHLVVVNVNKLNADNKDQANTWLHSNYVNNTPTLVVRDHGYAVYTYSGTNMKRFEQLLSGIDPETNQKFKLSKHPSTDIYHNDFTQSNAVISAFKPHSVASIDN